MFYGIYMVYDNKIGRLLSHRHIDEQTRRRIYSSLSYSPCEFTADENFFEEI